MTIATTTLAQGPGWRVDEVDCTAGPGDPDLDERHETVCMAIVTSGTFGYRSAQGRATLAPGAILLGNAGDCFACGHAHSAGDRCLSFHYEPGFYENVVSALSGASRIRFQRPSLPPLNAAARARVMAEAARPEPAALEEIAADFAGAVAAIAADLPPHRVARDARTARRIAEIARLLDDHAAEPLSLAWLAREAAMSPFHFLRTFRDQIGVTPYQYVLGRRIRRAALRLRRSDEPVVSVALDCGFNDISEFNRRFRKIMGLSPTRFRVLARSWPVSS